MSAGVELSERLSRRQAAAAVARCCARTAVLLAGRRLHLPHQHVGQVLAFADGTMARVYRETVVDRPPTTDPCVLVVRFRLRGVSGRGHQLFRWESLLNTVLFAGFPGLVSKLWLAHDANDVYRGVYEWDGPDLAEAYVAALWHVLALVSVPASIEHRVLAGLRVEEVLVDPRRLAGVRPQERCAWWRLVDTT